MAIADIAAYAHLTDGDIDSLGRELDLIRTDIEDSLGARDAKYIERTIRLQRALEVAGRLLIHGGRHAAVRYLGSLVLGVAKSIENMEIGHNVLHGQWDWMNDPEIHSATWEWDMVGPSEQWKRAHNYIHHTFTNIVDMDDDVGFGIIRITRDQPWRPIHLLQPLQNLLLAATFEWGIAIHDLETLPPGAGTGRWRDRADVRGLAGKILRQAAKDYVVFPLLAGRRWWQTLKANAVANLLRNLWAYLVIFCGHFPDGAEKFTAEDKRTERREEWYLRQMLGTANFHAGRTMAFLSGNLCYQIEHHLFPDLPSNRYAEISVRVRELCAKYDIPYTTGSLLKQYLLVLRTIHKLSLPDSFLRATSDDAPETASEYRFRPRLPAALTGPNGPQLPAMPTLPKVQDGARRGLATAIHELRQARSRAAKRARRAAEKAAERAQRAAGNAAGKAQQRLARTGTV